MDHAKAARDPWVWGQLALFMVIALAAPLVPRYISLGQADFLLNRIDPWRIRWLGAVIIALGAAVVGWGARSLGRSLTPGTEPLPRGELVTTGPFAHARHPIYAGLVLLVTGYTLLWSNWTLALILGFIALQFFGAKSRVEEKKMMRRFPDYQSYMRRVRRRVL
jgi:protein-S-isoprenylcysteine O-methyltransferase Ste14